MKNRSVAFLVVVCGVTLATLALGSAGCASKKPNPVMAAPEIADAGADDADAAPTAPKTLYERLAGKEGIAAVVDATVKNVQADPAVKKVFAKTTGPRLDHFKEGLVEQICEATEGPCKYTGKDMKAAHKGLGINEAQWDAFIKDFTLALDENKVGEKEKSELFALLAPMHDDVVEKKAKK